MPININNTTDFETTITVFQVSDRNSVTTEGKGVLHIESIFEGSRLAVFHTTCPWLTKTGKIFVRTGNVLEKNTEDDKVIIWNNIRNNKVVKAVGIEVFLVLQTGKNLLWKAVCN